MKSGYLPDVVDNRDVWQDELFGAGTLPDKFLIEDLPFRHQGAWPICVPEALRTILQHHWKKQGVEAQFSSLHTFFRSNGSFQGSRFRDNLNTGVKVGVIPYDKLPLENVDNLSSWNEKREQALKLEGEAFIDGYVRVNPNPYDIMQSIIAHGVVMADAAAYGDYYKDMQKRPYGASNHATCIAGFEKNVCWYFHDTLQPKAGFDGYLRKDWSYTFSSVYAVTSMPAKWREKAETARREPFEVCLAHYGLKRDFLLEKQKAAEIYYHLKKLNNPAIEHIAGRFWTVLINMATYGGYSVVYHKFGLKFTGDVFNWLYHFNRTGTYVFDPNKIRSHFS